MITGELIDRLDPQVTELALLTEATIILESEYYSMGYGIKIPNVHYGVYIVSLDIIVIADKTLNHKYKLNEVVLHELVHWSGHPKRLNRPFMKRFFAGQYNDGDIMASEECTAQYGAYKLMQHFAMFPTERLLGLTSYLKLWVDFEPKGYEQMAGRAVDYLKGLYFAKRKKVA